MTKVETMDQNIKQLTSINTAMEATIQTLHEGQLSMDNNIKILMLKMGIQTGHQPKNTVKKKENTRAVTKSEANESNTWINVDGINTQREDEEMD